MFHDERGEGSSAAVAIIALVAIAAVVLIAVYVMGNKPEETPEQPGIDINLPAPEPMPEPIPADGGNY